MLVPDYCGTERQNQSLRTNFARMHRYIWPDIVSYNQIFSSIA